MRLTLRTLLAWLDDTLPPAEVRQIGHQVNDSPFAQELVDRIQKVARRRRLTVPSGTGPEATDPNVVASYLDNELPPEQVAEFEKLCLTSDVHLAEVASVHQILSLIGQRAKVPPEARQRMYHLVKGREAATAGAPRQFTPPAEPDGPPAPPWQADDLPRRPWLDRYGPAAAVAGLLLALAWSAWAILPRDAGELDPEELAALEPAPAAPEAGAEAEAQPKARPAPEVAPPAAPPRAVSGTAAGPAAEAEPVAEPPEPAARTGAEAEAVAKVEPEAEPEAEAEAEAEVDPVRPGLVEVKDTGGVLLRFDAATSAWRRLEPGTRLKPDDRIVGLEPYRNAVQFGSVRVDLVGAVELRVRKGPAGMAGALELEHGRAVVHAGTPAEPLGLAVGDALLTLNPPSGGAPIGLVGEALREPGAAQAEPISVRLYVPKGEATLTAKGATATLNGPAAVSYRAGEGFVRQATEPAPAWVTEEEPSAADQELGRQFAENFAPGAPAMRGIVEAMAAGDPDQRRLAVSALAATGSLDELTVALSTPDEPALRREIIAALRRVAARSPEAAADLKAALVRTGGPDWAELVEKQLVGYTAAEAADESTYRDLVGLLEHPDVGVRQLALGNLLSLTGRGDALGYDPDVPEGDGLQEWKTLLNTKQLKPQPVPPPRTRGASLRLHTRQLMTS